MASTGVRAEPGALTRLADQVLRCAQQIADTVRVAQGPLSWPPSACGDSAAATAVHDAHAGTVDALGVTAGRLVAVLEGDMDRLYRVAFAYLQADTAAGSQFPVIPV